MNRIILGFFFVLLTSRFFSETLKVAPKAIDLIDIIFIPMLCVGAVFAGRTGHVDRVLHGKMFRWVAAFAIVSVLSAIVNVSRSHYAPVALFVFGMLEGPALFLALNGLVKKKAQFAVQTARFLYIMFIIEGAVVIFLNMPLFFATGNPDYVSGTFGLNAYQFSALLIIIGGYFLGRMRAGTMNLTMSIAIQGAVVLTFLMLQYRTATPAFFIAYVVLIGVMYGKRVVRMVFAVTTMLAIGYLAFAYIASSNVDLKFDDLVELAESPGQAVGFGKVIAYGNVFDMYGDQPATLLLGAGPGTMVSRSAYTFIVEPLQETDKGVGKFITEAFGNQDFMTDVFKEYVQPLFAMEAVFGSDQANNPASSLLSSMAELGIIGLVLIGLIYGTLVRRALSYLRFAGTRLDPELLPLAAALVAGTIYLVLLAPLDNYLEMARVTLPVWLLFWTVSALVHLRRESERSMRNEQYELLARVSIINETGVSDEIPYNVRAQR